MMAHTIDIACDRGRKPRFAWRALALFTRWSALLIERHRVAYGRLIPPRRCDRDERHRHALRRHDDDVKRRDRLSSRRTIDRRALFPISNDDRAAFALTL